jgi:hypothetical protein
LDVITPRPLPGCFAGDELVHLLWKIHQVARLKPDSRSHSLLMEPQAQANRKVSQTACAMIWSGNRWRLSLTGLVMLARKPQATAQTLLWHLR